METAGPRRLVVRADGDARIGGGHLCRVLALAAAAREAGCEVTLAAVSIVPALKTQAASRVNEICTQHVVPGSLDDALWIVELARSAGAHWIVVDGYAFDGKYRSILRTAGCRFLVVDDFGADDLGDADVIVNQNVFASPGMYPGTAARLLLGPTYALVDPGFRAVRAGGPRRPDAVHVVVTLGAADPAGLTGPVTAALLRLPNPRLRVTIVVGGASRASVDQLRSPNDDRLTVLEQVKEMAPVLASATAVITGAGTTVYEACVLGVPVVVLPIVATQQPTAAALAAAELAHVPRSDPRGEPDRFAGEIDAVLNDAERLIQLSRKGRDMVDGEGARRVVEIITATRSSA